MAVSSSEMFSKLCYKSPLKFNASHLLSETARYRLFSVKECNYLENLHFGVGRFELEIL